VQRETAQLTFLSQGVTFKGVFDITDLGENDIVLGIPWLQRYNPQIDWITGQLRFPGQETEGLQLIPRRDLASEKDTKPSSKSMNIRIMGYAAQPTDSSTSIRTVDIPDEYRKYDKLFQETLKTGLPEHSNYDHEIPLKEGTQPNFYKIYPLNEEKLKALQEYIDEHLAKGDIRPSTSLAGYPILFMPKKNGKLRLCVDYRQLNDITIKNRYPLPLISELRDRLTGAQWFTTLDLPGAYNLIRIKEGEEWKTAFRTRLGHYEYLVMPFGLTNAPASFQAMINDVLRPFLDNFVVVYLDDILIYSKTLEEYQQHVHQVLQALQDANLLVNPEKSIFHTQEALFLGHKIKPDTIEMEDAKVEAIATWPTPTTVKEIRGFLGFANYYRRFIKDFSEHATPLTNLTKKDNEFQ
jgi:hypothetical protein